MNSSDTEQPVMILAQLVTHQHIKLLIRRQIKSGHSARFLFPLREETLTYDRHVHRVQPYQDPHAQPLQ